MFASASDRAEIDDVARQLVVDRIAGEDVDFAVVPAIDDFQFGAAGDLAGEADTARAHDAAVGEERNMLADVGFVRRRVLRVDHSARRMAIAVAEILQHAFAGLVADGAIERMVEQDAFERLGLRGLGFGAIGDADGAVLGRRLAGGHDARLHRHRAVGLLLARLHQAHAAAGDHRERRMPAIARDEHAGFLRRLDQVQPLVADVHRGVVDIDDSHARLYHFLIELNESGVTSSGRENSSGTPRHRRERPGRSRSSSRGASSSNRVCRARRLLHSRL